MPYSVLRLVANIGGSSVLTLTRTPAATRSRMGFQVGHNLECHVGGRADVQGDVVGDQMIKECLIIHRADAVLDPFCAEIADGVPNGLRAGRLASVRHAVQTRRPGAIDITSEHRPRKATFCTSDTEAHQAGNVMITRDRGGELGARNAEVRRNIEDPAQLHSMVTGSGDASVLNRASRKASAGNRSLTD